MPRSVDNILHQLGWSWTDIVVYDLTCGEFLNAFVSCNSVEDVCNTLRIPPDTYWTAMIKIFGVNGNYIPQEPYE